MIALETIEQNIHRVKYVFEKQATTEKISDWQGNLDFKDYEMYVLRNALISSIVPDSIEQLQKQTGCDLPWAEDHFQERISGEPTNPGETYKYWPYHSNLDNSKYKDETFSHTYQERFWPKLAGNSHMNPLTLIENEKGKYSGYRPRKGIRFQYGDLKDIIDLLSKNPKTRQAYLPIWFTEDTWAANNGHRVPCTIGYYFWITDGKLHCNYTIRSCDLFRHFRNDIYLTCRLMQYMAKELNIGLSSMTMYIYNLHLFKNDMYAYNKKEKKLCSE